MLRMRVPADREGTYGAKSRISAAVRPLLLRDLGNRIANACYCGGPAGIRPKRRSRKRRSRSGRIVGHSYEGMSALAT
jgi:hypothetical protein